MDESPRQQATSCHHRWSRRRAFFTGAVMHVSSFRSIIFTFSPTSSLYFSPLDVHFGCATTWVPTLREVENLSKKLSPPNPPPSPPSHSLCDNTQEVVRGPETTSSKKYINTQVTEDRKPRRRKKKRISVINGCDANVVRAPSFQKSGQSGAVSTQASLPSGVVRGGGG